MISIQISIKADNESVLLPSMPINEDISGHPFLHCKIPPLHPGTIRASHYCNTILPNQTTNRRNNMNWNEKFCLRPLWTLLLISPKMPPWGVLTEPQISKGHPFSSWQSIQGRKQYFRKRCQQLVGIKCPKLQAFLQLRNQLLLAQEAEHFETPFPHVTEQSLTAMLLTHLQKASHNPLY